MSDMQGPWDEIGYISESGVNEARVGDHIVAQREDGRFIFGRVVEITEDTPLAGQDHLEPPTPAMEVSEDTPLAGQDHLEPPTPAMEVSESGHLHVPDDKLDRPSGDDLDLADLIPAKEVDLHAFEAREQARERARTEWQRWYAGLSDWRRSHVDEFGDLPVVIRIYRGL